MKRLSPLIVILAAVAAAVALLRSGEKTEEDHPEQWKPVRPA
ncbi:MAG TPA: hypothetical protein VFO17_02715 [Acidimicrobiia bacterium]|nr:hypothetical protein [Acidimicrobiia bacterium]